VGPGQGVCAVEVVGAAAHERQAAPFASRACVFLRNRSQRRESSLACLGGLAEGAGGRGSTVNFFGGGKRLAAVATMTVGLLVGAAPAHAWYVDISITGGGRVYETTDANELDEHCPDAIEGIASQGTTPTGQLGATCRAGDAAGDYGHGWVVRYVAEPAPGYRFDGWRSDGRTSPAPVLCDGSDGSSSYAGAACQFQIWANLQTRAVFVDDTPPVMAALTGPTSEVNGPASFTFNAVADPTLARFECRVAGVHDWVTCSSGRQENPAASGTYTFEVRAVDWSENRSGTSSVQWAVDKISPDTTITGGASGPVASTSATFTFTGSSDVIGYTCTLDGVAAPCQSPKIYTSLSQGTHTFAVQARDDAGNTDATPDTRTWTVDTVAPQSTITDGPAEGAITSSRSATFTFSSNEPGTLECQLDGTGWTTCEAPRSYTDLSEGAHTFAVRARDAAGNVDGTPATRSWTVDTIAPQTTITDGPVEGATSTSQSATFTFDSTEGGTFECQIDGGPWAVCESPRASAGLSEGAHTFAVRARDAAGNIDGTPAARSWTVDVTDASPPPVIGGETIVSSPEAMDVRTRFRYRVSDGRTTVRQLKLTALSPTATVKVSCKGMGCAFKSKTLKPSTSYVVLTKLFKNRKLSAGTVIKLRITAAGYEPTAFRYRTRKGTKPPIGGQVARHTATNALRPSGFGPV
jgi:hypothetical protein